jgi:hypothetical protein
LKSGWKSRGIETALPPDAAGVVDDFHITSGGVGLGLDGDVVGARGAASEKQGAQKRGRK